MADIEELSVRLLKRFKDVPNVDEEDADGWAELAMNEHGFDRDADVPTELVPLVLLYGEADGASQVALRTAYFFKYSDKDESVDKIRVADNYRRLADSLWVRYKQRRSEGAGDYGGSRFVIMTRADRP